MNQPIIQCSTTELLNVYPWMLNADIKRHILTILKSKEGTCTSLGCIISIVSIDEIGDAEVKLCDKFVKFCVRYTFQLLKLERNKIYTGIVYKVYSEGMLVDIEGIPGLRVMTNYTANTEPSAVVNLILKDFVFTDNSYTGIGVV